MQMGVVMCAPSYLRRGPALLGVTGLLMFREKYWLRSRSFWLIVAGVVIPLIGTLHL